MIEEQRQFNLLHRNCNCRLICFARRAFDVMQPVSVLFGLCWCRALTDLVRGAVVGFAFLLLLCLWLCVEMYGLNIIDLFWFLPLPVTHTRTGRDKIYSLFYFWCTNIDMGIGVVLVYVGGFCPEIVFLQRWIWAEKDHLNFVPVIFECELSVPVKSCATHWYDTCFISFYQNFACWKALSHWFLSRGKMSWAKMLQ